MTFMIPPLLLPDKVHYVFLSEITKTRDCLKDLPTELFAIFMAAKQLIVEIFSLKIIISSNMEQIPMKGLLNYQGKKYYSKDL